MITLTTPPQINSVLGGATLVNYERLVLTPFTMDPAANTISASLRLTSTSSTDMQPIVGGVTVRGSELIIEIPQIRFYRRIALTAGQQTALQTIIRDAQNALENGLLTLGVIAGAQSAGV